MSSHHTVKFFLNHYQQQGAAVQRKELKAQIRELRRQEDIVKWAEYRHRRAVAKAAVEFAYYTDFAFAIIFLLTVLSIVVFALRNI